MVEDLLCFLDRKACFSTQKHRNYNLDKRVLTMDSTLFRSRRGGGGGKGKNPKF